MSAPVMVDRHGHRVSAMVLDGVPTFTVTSPHGGRIGGYVREPRTVADLEAMGVDVKTLVDAVD